MKFNCSKQNLLNAVQIVSKAVPSKTTMDILMCILVEAEDNKIKLTANDMELGIETEIEADVVEKGIIAIDSKIFQEIVRKLPDSTVYIDTNDKNEVSIICDKAEFSINGKAGDDFSYLPELEKGTPLILSQFSLKDIIGKTIFSLSDNENNKIMTGELFDIKENVLKVVALDGHRISINKITLKDVYENKKVIIPGKTLNEISKIISGEISEDIYIYFTENHVLFEFNNTKVVSRIIEGEYFDVDLMLSNDYETKFEINKKDFIDCIERAMLLIKDGNKKPIIITVNDNKIELKINSVIGSMNEEIEVIKSGRDLMIGFNPKFVLDALRVIDDELINVYMVNAKAPCIIKNDTESYIYMILPINFNTYD